MATQGAKQFGVARCLGTKLRQAGKMHVVRATRGEGHALAATGSRGVKGV